MRALEGFKPSARWQQALRGLQTGWTRARWLESQEGDRPGWRAAAGTGRGGGAARPWLCVWGEGGELTGPCSPGLPRLPLPQRLSQPGSGVGEGCASVSVFLLREVECPSCWKGRAVCGCGRGRRCRWGGVCLPWFPAGFQEAPGCLPGGGGRGCNRTGFPLGPMPRRGGRPGVRGSGLPGGWPPRALRAGQEAEAQAPPR